MSETSEMPTPQEMHAKNPVVTSVRGAIDKAGEDTQSFNQEYWQIRKELQGRMDWHGGGIYKLYVQNMDKVTDVLWGGKNRSWGAKIMEVKDRIWTRLSGAFLGYGSASADLIWNAATWLPRKFLPIPKDVHKRIAVGLITKQTIESSVSGGLLAVGKASTEYAIESEKRAVRQMRTVGEAAVTAPEVAATMAKRRVEKAMYNILHPQNAQKLPKA